MKLIAEFFRANKEFPFWVIIVVLAFGAGAWYDIDTQQMRNKERVECEAVVGRMYVQKGREHFCVQGTRVEIRGGVQ